MSRTRVLWILLLATTTASAATATTVALDRSQQTLAGLRTQPAHTVEIAAQTSALGKVLAPEPWITFTARLETAAAAASASAAEAARLRHLFDSGRNASLKALQAAQAQARADALRRDALRRELRLQWGAELGALNAAERERLSRQLADGVAVLVRADAPGASTDAAPTAATLRALGSGPAIAAQVLGPAPNVDPALQAPAWLLCVAGTDARRLRPGQALRISLQLAGPTRRAIVVPEAAIVRIAGQPYAYVQTGPERFERHALELLAPHGDGWAAQTDIRSGAALVIAGADALWRAEQAPPAGTGEEEDPD